MKIIAAHPETTQPWVTFVDVALIVTDRELILSSPREDKIYEFLSIRIARVESVGRRYQVHFRDEASKRDVTVRFPNLDWRDRFLDAYQAVHPYPGEPICWYCQKSPGEGRFGVVVPLHREIDRGGDTTMVSVTYSRMELTVARCGRCEQIHREILWRKVIAGLFLLVGIVGLLACIAGMTPDLRNCVANVRGYPFLLVGIALVSILMLVSGITFLVRAVRTWNRHGIREKHDTRLFPPLRKLWKVGYRYGKKPTELEMCYGVEETENHCR